MPPGTPRGAAYLTCVPSITAGASAPEVIVEEIMGAFAERFELHVETVSAAEENEFFPLPRSLRPDAA